MNTTVLERFLKYIKVDTMSQPEQESIPSTEKQKDLANILAQELRDMGAKDVKIDSHAYVYGTIPATTDKKVPVLGFIAHMDTAPAYSGKGVNPQFFSNYDGKTVVMNKDTGLSMGPEQYPDLLNYVGQDLITTDGTTLLGADDKAGIAEIMALAGEDGPLALRRALTRSRMLSSDVSAGFDPAYASVYEAKNSAYLGRGLVFNKYTGARGKSGSNDASAEYVALVRRIMDDAHVSFQTAELGRVDAGGGGTIAYIPAKYGMDVIDSGVAVLSMHAPWEVTSKADIYEARRGYEAFLRDAS